MKHMDERLNQALAPENEPDYGLIQNILSQSKEATPMKKTSKRYVIAVLSCLLALGITSVSVYAAWRYLKPDEIAGEMGTDELAEAFSGENAVYINETQSFGGYDVTLLGITSGKKLTSYKYLTDDGEILEDRSYIMIAMEGENLTYDSFYSEFDVFPIITGYDSDICKNIALTNGSGGRFFTKDGVIYHMYECSSLEKFADHAIYLCISDDLPSFSEYSYLYDSASGTICRNEQYEGLNALFFLPLDPAKADPKAAKEVADAYQEHQKELARQEKELKEHPELNRFSKKEQEIFDLAKQVTPENIDELATPLTGEEAVYTFVPDSQGRLNVRYSHNGLISRSKIALKDLFADGQTRCVSPSGIANDMSLELYTLNEDGSVTLQMYQLNLPE